MKIIGTKNCVTAYITAHILRKRAHKHPIIIAHCRGYLNCVSFGQKCNTDALDGTLFIVKTTSPMTLGREELMG